MNKEPNKNNKKIRKSEKIDEVGTEMCDVERILKERGKKGGSSHQYFCSWMDGCDPQWVDAIYLQDTLALEEWQEAEEVVPEVFDNEMVIEEKTNLLAKWIKESKRCSWLVGAGISSSVLPTFRGSQGLWTKAAPSLTSRKRKDMTMTDTSLDPTTSHLALVTLEKNGYVNYLASQNYDDLLARANFPASKLSELHGNIYKETCVRCTKVYHRDFEVELQLPTAVKAHETGRVCDDVSCGGKLRDNIVHFGESLPWRDLSMANAKFLGSDLTIVLGSSLKVEPAASLPFKAKRRTRKENGAKPLRAVIVNLQPTPCDSEADLVIHAKCDDILSKLLDILELSVTNTDC